MPVTFHGKKRVKERLGIPHRAANRSFEHVIAKGKKRFEFTGNVRRYLEMLALKGKRYGTNAEPIVFGDYIFLVAEEGNGPFLVTTVPMPKKFRKRKFRKGYEIDEEVQEAAE